MRIENQVLIEEFYEKVKHKYPGVSFEEFKLSCTTPFLNVKKEMESGELKTVRLSSFGTFLVYPKRVESVLNNMKQQFKDLKIDSKFFFAKKEMFEKYLTKHGK